MNQYSKLSKLPTGQTSEDLIDACLVLEGGAFRGVYTSGVLDVLMKNNLNFSCVIGVSAGALNAMNYVSGQIGRSARINLGYRHDSRYVGNKAIMKNKGVIGFDFLFNDYPKIEYFNEERFYRPEQRMIAVATECATGEACYFEKGKGTDFFQAVRASASMQYVSKMVDVDGIKCLDGGGSVHFPFRWAVEQGYKKIIVVRTRHRGFRCTPDDMFIGNYLYKNFPVYQDKLIRNHEIYNEQCDALEQLEDEGRVFTIYPSRPITIGRLESDMEKLGKLYWRGQKDMKAELSALKAYLDDAVVRRTHIGDEKALATIQTTSWRSAFNEIFEEDLLMRVTDPEKAESMYTGLLKDHIGNGYILEIDDKPNSFAFWDKSRLEDLEGYAELIAIYSLPDNWGKGYGRLLLERVLKDIKAAGYKKVMLWTLADNHRARAVYEKLGFTLTDRSQLALGKPEVMYEKVLK